MSVFVNDPDALDRLAAVEGEGWKQSQLGRKDQPSDYTYFGLRAKYNEAKAEADLLRWEMDDLDTMGMVIYGDGGYARYSIRGDGEIVLLKWSTREERIKLAEQQGFTVV